MQASDNMAPDMKHVSGRSNGGLRFAKRRALFFFGANLDA
jgi:hypothetical protein